MAGEIISTNQTTTYSGDTTDTIYLSRWTSILATTGDGISNRTASDDQITVFVAGEVAALGNGNTAVELWGTATADDYTTNGYNSINIQTTGIVTGNWFGVSVAGLRNSVSNDGAIYAVGAGIYSLGGDSNFVNTGTISSDSNAVRLVGSWSGNILGTMNYVENSGTLSAKGTAVTGWDASITLVNTGLITSSGSGLGITIYGGVSYLDVVNYGTITSGTNSTLGSISAFDNADAVKNFGALIGDVWLQGGTDVFKNAGTLVGDANLGDGNDLYKGSGDGSVSGTINGGAGDDTLKGGNLSDDMNGGAGVDLLMGRGGDDTLTDTIGNDIFWGGAGNDTMNAGAGANKMYGGRGDDTINAGSGSDTVKGGNGNDTITGGNGKDILYGNDGNDVINGGGKADTIYGGGGNDTLTGSSGADIFVFTQRAGDDVITDFTNNSDKIDLTAFGLSSAAGIITASTSVTGGVVIDLDMIGGSGSIFLAGFNGAFLDGSDFIV